MMSIKTILKMFILGMLLFVHCAEASPSQLDKIVAVVNSRVITQSELDKRVAIMQRNLGGDGVTSNISALRKRALDDLIDISLQLQLAKRNGIQIGDNELNNIINNIAKTNNLTLAELKATIQEKEGISFTEFRNRIREQGLISKVQQQFLGREIIVSGKEVEAVLRNPPKVDKVITQYHVLDILFRIGDETTKDQIENIINEAKQVLIELQQKNADIDKVVNESQSRLKEGVIQKEDLGWRKINELPELFAKEVVKMRVTQVVGPIQAPNGIHLLKLLDINAPLPTKLTRDQAEEIIYRRKLAKKIEPWIKELRKNAYIKFLN